MLNNTVEIRVTRPSKYPAAVKASGREGYYFRGANESEAEAKARRRFPSETLDVELWRQWDKNGKPVI